MVLETWNLARLTVEKIVHTSVGFEPQAKPVKIKYFSKPSLPVEPPVSEPCSCCTLRIVD